ncbi:MAG: UpxY family transcription antiterminator [Chlorobi bacterium]|nr:UpxY family transcription antiterminator [Chlorobiota bacterium]
MDNTKNIEFHWYPLYTKSRHEKTAYNQLLKFGYEAFLPLQKTVRQWSDRKKIVELPLISSYVFVRIPKNKLYDVVNIYGISRYISFNGLPAIIQDNEIELLKLAIENKNEIEVADRNFKKGTEIKFSTGIFKGYSGKVIKQSGKNKLVVELESMGKTILITVDISQLKAS